MSTYSIVIVKATRKPIVLASKLNFLAAKDLAYTHYKHTQFLHTHNLASSGISYQIILDEYIPLVETMQIGAPEFLKIPISFQIGGY